MRRVRWTDERLDERMTATDHTFERVFAELRAQREEMRAGFAELHADIVGLQRQVVSIVTGLVVALIGLLAAAQF